MRLFALFAVCLLMVATQVSAQDTDTPTPAHTDTPTETATATITPTPSSTPSSTPELVVYMTLPAPSSTGTPQAPQYMAVRMEATVGDIAIVILLVALFVLSLVSFAMGRK